MFSYIVTTRGMIETRFKEDPFSLESSVPVCVGDSISIDGAVTPSKVTHVVHVFVDGNEYHNLVVE